MTPSEAVIRTIVRGERPPQGEMVGVALDGKSLPRREEVRREGVPAQSYGWNSRPFS